MASLAERGQAAFAWCLPSQKGVTEHGRGQRKKWSARETRRGKGEGSCVSTVRPRGSEGGCAEHCDPEQGCRWLLVSCLQLHQVDHDPPQRDRKEGRHWEQKLSFDLMAAQLPFLQWPWALG